MAFCRFHVSVVVAFACCAGMTAGCRGYFPTYARRTVVPSSLAPPARMYVTEEHLGERLAASVPSLKGLPTVVVAPGGVPDAIHAWPTPWTTDQWMFVYRNGQLTAWEFPGERGLTEWGDIHLRDQGVPVVRMGGLRPFPESRFDAGGNVLAAPSRRHTSVAGAFVIGEGLHPEIKRLLRRAVPGGTLIELDTDWLKVGHVDEIVAFLPGCADGGAPSFRVALPDAEAGLALLKTAPPDRVLFSGGVVRHGTVVGSGARFIDHAQGDSETNRWTVARIVSGRSAGLVGRIFRTEGARSGIDHCWDMRGASVSLTQGMAREGRVETMPIWPDPPEPGSRTVMLEAPLMWLDGAGAVFPAAVTAGELVRDRTLADVARAIDSRIYGKGGIKDRLVRGLGLREDAIVKIPVLFRGWPDGLNVTALVPNPLNLVCFDRHVVLLKPFGPRLEPDDETSDLFLRAWSDILVALDLNPVFLDGWNELHRHEGGVRCGVNVLRTVPDIGISPRSVSTP